MRNIYLNGLMINNINYNVTPSGLYNEINNFYYNNITPSGLKARKPQRGVIIIKNETNRNQKPEGVK